VNAASEQRFSIQYPTWIYLVPKYKVISITFVAKILVFTCFVINILVVYTIYKMKRKTFQLEIKENTLTFRPY